MKPVQFVYFVILLTVAGVNVVAIDDLETCEDLCGQTSTSIDCPELSTPTLVGQCWTCCTDCCSGD
ncbi:hypothetical protein BDR04DRAFT_1094936, partial [Suillus decipiens]